MTSSQFQALKSENGKTFYFRDVIKDMEGYEVLKFNNDKLLKKVKEVCQNIISPVNKAKKNDPMFPKRANEFGNYVERYFLEKCIEMQLEYKKPTEKESGYPDGLLYFDNKYYYIEIKTCEENSLKSSFRSFFYSPSKNPKIEHDAPHLLIGFETIKNELQLNGMFLIADMYDKKVTLKLEYNTNNKELYKSEGLLIKASPPKVSSSC
ncbi:MAG: hypothetical protein LBP55_01810 [Candidatus Adiutrix sp.]|jgi:hypothetical protein|nr:hypothetical protein [Candidatus Adiutrix sp.]